MVEHECEHRLSPNLLNVSRKDTGRNFPSLGWAKSTKTSHQNNWQTEPAETHKSGKSLHSRASGASKPAKTFSKSRLKAPGEQDKRTQEGKMKADEWVELILKTKKAKHLYEALCDIEVVRQGAEDAYDALTDKDRWYAEEYRKDPEKTIAKVHRMFLTKTFPKRTYRKVTIKTREKEREIEPQPFNPWSIITHSIKLVLEPVIERLLIYDASAGIRGKGQVFAARRIKRLIRRNRGKGWFVDTDLRKFYPSIPHKVAIDALKQHVDDADFIEVFTKVIEGYDSEIEEVLQEEVERKKLYCQRWAKGNEAPAHYDKRGITIGDPISQNTGNLCLASVDRSMTEKYGVKAYHRHCDDILMLAETKEQAFYFLSALNKEMNKLGFVIKASAVVAPLADPGKGIQGRWIDAAGYNYSRTNMRMRKATKKRMARLMTRVKSRKRMTELRGAYFGICKWGKCKNLWQTMKRNSIMSFAEFGINTEVIRTGKDGKRFFDCPEVKVSELAQEKTPIVVYDFENGITIDGKSGKVLVLFKKETGSEDAWLKFITSSSRIADKMEKARKLQNEGQTKVFPNHTYVFEVRLKGGRFTYDIA